MQRTRKPTHPGIAFKELVIEEGCCSIAKVARRFKVTREHLSKVLNGKERLSRDMAESMAKFTNTSIKSWYDMQLNLDLWELENT